MSAAASSPVRFRGVAVGTFTAVLALAAHSLVVPTIPGGGPVALLTVLAVGLGALVSGSDRAARPALLVVALTAGQVAGHLALSTGAHDHLPAAGPPSPLMLATHAAAVLAAALLVVAAERCYATLSSVLRTAVRPPHTHAVGRPGAALPPSDHPPRRALLIAASISHRGPPVTAAR